MKTVRILYVDDVADQELSKYLDNLKMEDEIEIIYEELRYKPEYGYEQLIRNNNVWLSNIIIIDSYLFNNGTKSMNDITGEEFMIILKKINPFIEVIIITQNELGDEIDFIRKCNGDREEEYFDYYEKVLKKHISYSIRKLKENWILTDRVINNNVFEKVLREKIENTISGSMVYEQFTKNDIDDLVKAFQEIKDKLIDE